MREEKKRHGCLAAWLVVIIIMSSITLLGYTILILSRNLMSRLLQDQMFQGLERSQLLQIQTVLNTPVWFYMILMGLAIFNIVCVIALFAWRKWGFWGFIASSIVVLVLNIIFLSGGPSTIITGIASTSLLVLVLFGVLHIGRENKGWPQLK